MKTPIRISKHTLFVEYRTDSDSTNVHNGLNYRIFTSLNARLPISGAMSWGAFVDTINRIQSGSWDEIINENRKHYEEGATA